MRALRVIVAGLVWCCAGVLLGAAPAPAAGLAPTVEGLVATGVTPYALTLEATVDPENEPATCEFDYGTTTAYGTEVACEQGTTLEGEAQLATLHLDGLKTDSTYYYKLVVKNATGEATAEGKATTLTAQAPIVESESVTGITPDAATLEGTLNPDSQRTAYSFEYSTRASGETLEGTITTVKGEIFSPEEFGERHAGVSISSSLVPATSYYYRLVAKNATGTSRGKVESFTTLPLVAPIVENESVAGVTPFEGTLEAQVNPDSQETTYSLEYATKATGEILQGAITTVDGGSPLAAVYGGQGVSVSTGRVLNPTSTYYYRVVAKNATGTTKGKVESFTTLTAEKPIIESESVLAPGSSEAGLEAVVNPNYQATRDHFEYSTGATGETLQGTVKTAEGPSIVAVLPAVFGGQDAGPAQISGLVPNTTYYYRVLASNATGETRGAVQSFTTLPAPLVSTGGVSAIEQTSAGVTGTVDPDGLETYYYYQYGPSTEYGQSTAPENAGVDVGAGTTPVTAPGILVPLVPGVTYHYRLVAWNEAGTSYGQDQTFTASAGESPLATTNPASAISVDEATISGTIDPVGKETSYRFEYGTTTLYGTQIYGTVLPEQGIQTISVTLGGIVADTTYHYRLVVSNPGGTSYGQDMTFTTSPIAFPVIAPPPPPLLALPSYTFLTGPQIATQTGKSKTTRKQKHKQKSHKQAKHRRKKTEARGKQKKKKQ